MASTNTCIQLRRIAACALSVLVAAISSSAPAAVFTGGAGTDDWFTPGNWDTGVVPGLADPAIVNLLPGAAASADIGIDRLEVGTDQPGGVSGFGALAVNSGNLIIGPTGSSAEKLLVGTAQYGGNGSGTVSVAQGAISGRGPGNVYIGLLYGPGAAAGNATAWSVDLQDLTSLRIGVAYANPVPATGAASSAGSFSATSGEIQGGWFEVGRVVGDGSGSPIGNASGTLTLGGRIAGGATGLGAPYSPLYIGLAGSSPGSSAVGKVAVQRVDQFTEVLVGFSFQGGSATGTLDVGSGGIHGDGSGFLTIGQAVNSPTSAMEATGKVHVVGGGVDGFHTVLFDQGEFTVSGGRVQVIGVRNNPWDNGFGAFAVGSFRPGMLPQSAKFELTDGALDLKVTFVNFAAGSGALTRSTATILAPDSPGPEPFLTIGYGGAAGELKLVDSTWVMDHSLSLGYAAGAPSAPESVLELQRSLLESHGTAYFNPAARLRIGVEGASRGAEYGAVDAQSVSLGGTLEVVFGYTPTAGTSFYDLVRATKGGLSGITGAFGRIDVLGLAPDLVWRDEIVAYGDGTAFRLFVTNPIPEPSTWALLGVGVLTLIGTARRRTAR